MLFRNRCTQIVQCSALVTYGSAIGVVYVFFNGFLSRKSVLPMLGCVLLINLMANKYTLSVSS